MPLVQVADGTADWCDIKDAADIIWRATLTGNEDELCAALQDHYSDPALTVTNLDTGQDNVRRAVLVSRPERITLSFDDCQHDELMKNWWIDGSGPNWWDMPYPVYDNDGHRVHNFYLSTWIGLRTKAFYALNSAVDRLLAKGQVPQKIVITGFSMGGGVSVLAFTELLEHIRDTWGSSSTSPQSWARDENLGSLVQHFTFAAIAAADRGFCTLLNRVYARHSIRAWDFMCYRDRTSQVHNSVFLRCWRGHQYILPEPVVKRFDGDFGPAGRSIFGHLKVAEWMAKEKRKVIKSAYGTY